MPTIAAGKVAWKEGPMLASADSVDILVRGFRRSRGRAANDERSHRYRLGDCGDVADHREPRS